MSPRSELAASSGPGVPVLQVVTDRQRRGAQVFATQLEEHLNSRFGAQLRTVALDGRGRNALGVPALGTKPRGVRTLTRLRRSLRTSALAIAHGSSTLTACAVAATGLSVPWIYRNIGDPSEWGGVQMANLRVGLPLRRAAAVVALYGEARDYLIQQYGLDPSRVVTIPNAVPLHPPPSKEDRLLARSQLQLDPDRTWVGFVGSLTEEKRVIEAIRAVAAQPDLGLIVAGDGPQRTEAEAVAQRDARGRVRFLGVTDTPLRVMSAIDALLIPSRTEGIPAVAIEAGLSGVPVVATRVGGVPDVVMDGRTGVLVSDPSPGSLRRALQHALTQSPSLGAAARAHCVNHFTLDAVAPRWDELLTRTLEPHASGGR